MSELLRAGDDLVSAYFRCKADPFHPEDRPEGYIDLGTTENHLVWDLLEALGPRDGALTEADSHYQTLFGKADCREAVARHLSRLSRASVSAENLVLTAGATAALEILAFTLFDAGDVVLVAAPFYSGFAHAMCLRPKVELWPVPMRLENGFRPEIELFADGLAAARSAGKRVRGVIMSSPNNPVGFVHSPGELRDLRAFVAREDLQLVVDEIYAGSCFEPETFESVLAAASPRVHTVYGFAKDLALSGLAVGVVHSSNPDVLTCARDLAHFSRVSNSTQSSLAQILADGVRVQAFLGHSRVRVRSRLELLESFCRDEGIAMLEPDAGLFAFLDLGGWLEEPSFGAERQLLDRLLTSAHLNLAPGAGFGCPAPGWFRVAYAHPAPTLEVGLERLQRALHD